MDQQEGAGSQLDLIYSENGVMLACLARLAANALQADAAVITLQDRSGPGAVGPGDPVYCHGIESADAPLALALGAALPSDGVGFIPDLAADPATALHTLVAGPNGFRFLAQVAMRSPAGQLVGRVCVLGHPPRDTLPPYTAAVLEDLARVIITARGRERRQNHLVQASVRAIRADRILRLAVDAPTCAEALSSLLGELCRQHGARIGRIWQLQPDDSLHEISRFVTDAADADAYYNHGNAALVTARSSRTAEAIRLNQPQSFIYAQVDQPARYALLPGAMAAGLRSQVSFPVWIQDQRFGIALAFTREREDLDSIVADIASLASTIRPTLFRKVTEERIRFLAHHDALTQLGNRVLFNERLTDAVSAAGQSDKGLALLYLDLDGFKAINDQHGHALGDRLLAAVAARLRGSVRTDDTVARIGGDEFVIVQATEQQPEGAATLARRLLAALAAPFELDGRLLPVGASIGIAVHPAHGNSPEELLRHADIALYHVKNTGRNGFSLFEPVMDASQQQRLMIQRDLQDAFARRDFTLAFQPIIETATLRIRGIEALLRWDHPTRGPVPPGIFIPEAEQSGLILPLGRWALEAACEAAAALPVTPDGPLNLSVNLSPMQFRQPDLAPEIRDVLRRTGLAPDRLDLEVTEGLLLDTSGDVLRTMQDLRSQGIRITLDDFGTGYASLSYLRRFPFDRIKLDQSFVQGMIEDDGTMAIVEAILSLSRRLQLSVVAEGVETEDQLTLLRRLDCSFVQGHLTGRPATLGALRTTLAAARGSNVAWPGATCSRNVALSDKADRL